MFVPSSRARPAHLPRAQHTTCHTTPHPSPLPFPCVLYNSQVLWALYVCSSFCALRSRRRSMSSLQSTYCTFTVHSQNLRRLNSSCHIQHTVSFKFHFALCPVRQCETSPPMYACHSECLLALYTLHSCTPGFALQHTALLLYTTHATVHSASQAATCTARRCMRGIVRTPPRRARAS